MFKSLLFLRKLRKLENLVAKKGNYGSIKLFWCDGKGDWDGKIDLGMRQQILSRNPSEHHYLSVIEVVEEMIKKLEEL